jgi:2-dehydro-3-deoxygalactonokinase
VLRFNKVTSTSVSAERFIAGDWGTTNLRLFLCDAEGVRLESVVGPGAVEVRGEFDRVFDSLTSQWTQQWGPLPAILCGMVGSSIGWRQTGYLACPIEPRHIATSLVELREGRVRIVPGLSCRNRLDAPDLMRGEETQVLGALKIKPELREGRHLICLPGTHTKWVVVDDGAVTEILTAPTGELFAMIRDHSVLVSKRAHTCELDTVAFERGVSEVSRSPRVQLLHRIFECRSRWLGGDLAEQATASYLSGLLIASDVRGALELLADLRSDPVQLIGTPALIDLYSRALAAANRTVTCIDGENAVLAGLTHIYVLSRRTGSHAN